MNIKRITTSLIGFPIVIAFLVFGNKYMMDIAFAIIALIAMYEYTKCVSHKAKVISWIGYLCAATLSLVHIIPSEIASQITIIRFTNIIINFVFTCYYQ